MTKPSCDAAEELRLAVGWGLDVKAPDRARPQVGRQVHLRDDALAPVILELLGAPAREEPALVFSRFDLDAVGTVDRQLDNLIAAGPVGAPADEPPGTDAVDEVEDSRSSWRTLLLSCTDLADISETVAEQRGRSCPGRTASPAVPWR